MSLAMRIASSSVEKRNSGATGPNVSLARHRHRGGDPGEKGRLEEAASEGVARAADGHLRTLADRVRDVLLDLLDEGPCCVPSSSPLPTLSPATAAAIFAANAS